MGYMEGCYRINRCKLFFVFLNSLYRNLNFDWFGILSCVSLYNPHMKEVFFKNVQVKNEMKERKPRCTSFLGQLYCNFDKLNNTLIICTDIFAKWSPLGLFLIYQEFQFFFNWQCCVSVSLLYFIVTFCSISTNNLM